MPHIEAGGPTAIGKTGKRSGMGTITGRKKVFIGCGIWPGPDVPVCAADWTNLKLAVCTNGNGHKGGERL